MPPPAQHWSVMTIPFRPVRRVASRSATHKEAEMVQHPKTLIEFMQMYPTEEDCRQALFEHRWPHGFSCRRCGHCLLYTSDAADDLLCVDLGGRRIIKKKIR